MKCSPYRRRHPLRRLVTALSLCTSAALATGVPVPEAVFHGVPHDMLYGLSMEGRHGIAVGDFGLVVETEDGGRTWARQPAPPTEQSLFAVARRSGRCIAGGQQGLILTAPDCHQWRRAETITDARILAVDVNASGVAYAVGGFGTVLRSRDWGETWVALSPDWGALSSEGVEPHLYDVHVANSGEVTVVGEFETVLRSGDGGQSWQVLHTGTRSLFALKVVDNGHIFSVGQEGLVLRSVDAGRSWTELPVNTDSILTGVWAKADGRVVASGIYTILHSSDGGATWAADGSKSARAGWHQAVAGNSDGAGQCNVVLVGSGGAILSVQR